MRMCSPHFDTDQRYESSTYSTIRLRHQMVSISESGSCSGGDDDDDAVVLVLCSIRTFID
jgi:hypothetical protein